MNFAAVLYIYNLIIEFSDIFYVNTVGVTNIVDEFPTITF